MRKIFLSLLLLLLCLPAFNQHNEKALIVTTPSAFQTDLSIDSTIFIGKSHPFLIKQTRVPNTTSPCALPIFFFGSQLFYIPDSTRQVSVCINSRGKDIGFAEAHINIFDKEENIVLKDSLDINDTNWGKKETVYPAAGCRYIEIKLQIKGAAHPSEKDEQQMRFTTSVEADGKVLSPFDFPRSKTMHAQVERDKIIDIGIDEYTNLNSVLKEKKIVGLGESIHRSKTQQKCVFNIIKSRIMHEKCRLVLFENPMIEILPWELFVQGLLPEDEIDSIIEDVSNRSFFYDEDYLKEFLCLIRSHNLNSGQKVHVLGIDLPFGGSRPSHVRLHDFLEGLTAAQNHSIVKPFLDLLNKESDWRIILDSVLENEALLTNVIGKNHYDIFKTIVQQLIIKQSRYYDPPEIDPVYEYVYYRDFNMWLNTKLLTDSFLKEGETAVVYAHTAHIAKQRPPTQQLEQPLGYYLARQYGDEYVTVGIASGKGSTLVSKMSKEPIPRYPEISISVPVLDTIKLDRALPGSVEKFCETAGRSIFCYPAKEIPNEINYINFIGGTAGLWARSLYFFPKKYLDYIIYVETSSPIKAEYYRPFPSMDKNYSKANTKSK